MQKGAPVYVRINEYREVLDLITLLKNKIGEGNDLLTKINNIKAEEDKELEKWQTALDEVESRIAIIDKTLLDVKDM